MGLLGSDYLIVSRAGVNYKTTASEFLNQTNGPGLIIDLDEPVANAPGDLWMSDTALHYWDGTEWIDLTAGGGASVNIDANPPLESKNKEGDLWYNSDDGILYIWYVDDDSSQWVSVGGGGGSATLAGLEDVSLGDDIEDQASLIYDLENKRWVAGDGIPPAPPLVITEPVVTGEMTVGQLLTATTTISGGTPPYNVTWTWNQSESTSYNLPEESSDTYIIQEEDEGKKITASVVVTDSAGKTTGGESPEPEQEVQPKPDLTAVMSGLRFQKERKNGLTAPFNVNPSDYTVSMWVKTCNTSTSNRVIGGDNFQFLIKNSGFNVNNFGNGKDIEYGVGAFVNKWVHYVVQYHKDKVVVYVNGELAGQADAARGSGIAKNIYVGFYFPGDHGSDYYLSDFYGADGKIAPPTAFGSTIDGRWAPLDNSIVLQNLEAVQPSDPTPPEGLGDQTYDSRANTDEVWSNDLSSANGFEGGGEAVFAFDGNTQETRAKATSNPSTITFAPSTPISFTKSVKVWGFGNDGSVQLGSNGPAKLDGDGKIPVTVASGSGVINNSDNTLVFSDPKGKVGIRAIEVDGRLLVDTGVWNQNQQWSDGSDYDTNSGAGWDKAFDGNLTTHVGTKAGRRTTWTGDVTGSTFEIYGKENKWSSAVAIQVNGTDVRSHDTWVDVSSEAGGRLTSLSVADAGSSSYSNLRAVRVDGAILVDPGHQWNKSERWSNRGDGPSSGSQELPDANPPRGYAMMFDGNLESFMSPSASGQTAEANFTGMPTGNYEFLVKAENTSKITINGTEYANQNGWIDAGNIQLTSIVCAQDLSNSALVKAIKVDGKLLVDADEQWNTDQVWSVDSTGFSQPASNAFDGDLTTIATSEQGANAECSVTFDPIPASHIQVYFNSQSPSNSQDCKWFAITSDGRKEFPYPASGDFNNTWNTVYSGGEITVTGLGSQRNADGNGSATAGWMVDGKVLVDGAYTWNSSQKWSDNVVSSDGGFYANRPAVNLFDGSIETQCTTSTQGVGVSITTSFPDITYTDSIKVFCLNVNTIKVNDKPDATAVSGNWVTAATGGGTLSSIVFESNQANNTAGGCAIIVDGKLLVDAGLGVGGFYLPFDPTQTGANYSGGSVDNLPSEGGWDFVFNGLPGKTANDTVSTGPSSGDSTLTLGTTFSGNVVVYASANSGSDAGSGAEVILTHAGGSKSIPCAVKATGNPASDHGIDAGNLVDVSAITIKQATTGTKLYWIEVNGTMLVDHSSVGVEMSGQNSHFHDFNIGAGNISQIWSRGGDNGDLTGAGQWDDAFSAGTGKSPYFKDSTATYTFPSGTNGALTVHAVSAGTGAGSGTVTVKGVAHTFSFDSVGQKESHTFASGTDLGAITIAPSGLGIQITGFSLDGVQLIDPSALDTVLDTPVRSYNTLTGGKNGNLVGGGSRVNAAYTGEPGVTYYAEELQSGRNVVRELIRNDWDAFSTSGTDNRFNFGQLPFESTAIDTYDEETGIVTLKNANASETWSSKVSGDVTTDAANGFDGDPKTYLTTNGTTTFTGFGLSGVTSIEVQLSGGNTQTWTSDDGTIMWSSGASSENYFAFTPPANGVLNTFTVSGTNVSFMGMKVNGEQLIDSGTWNQSQVWSDDVVYENVSTQFEPRLAFNGNTNDGAGANRNSSGFATATFNFSPAITGSTINLILNCGNPSFSTNAWEVNSSGTVNELNVQGITTIDSGVTTLSKLVLTCNHITGDTGVTLYGIEVDGELLVDAGGSYPTLFQTWDQYARTVAGYTEDRIQSLERQLRERDITIQNILERLAALEAE